MHCFYLETINYDTSYNNLTLYINIFKKLSGEFLKLFYLYFISKLSFFIF